jgi:hypothetical protein
VAAGSTPAKTMAAGVVLAFVFVVLFMNEIVVTSFTPHFVMDNLAILNGMDPVVLGPAKVLADRLTVICNSSYLHEFLLFTYRIWV